MESRTRLHLLIRRGLASAALALGALPAGARVLLAQKNALALAFPDGRYERRTAFLSDSQAAAAESAARSKLDSKLWSYYVGGSTTAYFDSHPVRTMNETVMVVVGPGGTLSFVEVLAFAEPEDFLPSQAWLAQFPGRRLNDELALRRGLRGIAGATLSSEALASAVRRALAVHAVLSGKVAPKVIDSPR